MNKTVTRMRPFVENGNKILKLRKRTGLSQERISPAAGITRRYWIQLEKGENLPSAQVRDRMAAALGVGADEIRSSDDDEEESSMALTRDEQDVLVALFARIAQRVPA